MLKLIIHISIITIGINHVSATSCHELHQSQLISLNERMNQMIDTISSLLPQPLKKPKIPVPPSLTPPVDYLPSAPSYQTPYTPSPVYTTLPPSPQIMYVAPSYTPIPTAVVIPTPMQPNSMLLPPSHYPQTETSLQVDYTFPSNSNLAPRFARSHYQYENKPVAVSNPPPRTYPLNPYSHLQQYSGDYNRPSPEFPLAAPVYPQVAPYSPGLSHLPVPIYPMHPEMLPSQYAIP